MQTLQRAVSFTFLREEQNGDRFILKLEGLNLSINPPHFKMEHMKTALRLIRPNCYFAYRRKTSSHKLS